MAVLFGILWPLERVNGALLAVGRVLAVIALVVMVCLILGQVFFRYVLDDAPAWTEEGARFGMLWLTGLMAPMAYRQGGFVAIDMLADALPRLLAGILGLAILLVSLWVLVTMLNVGINNHFFSLSGRGNAPSLRLPLNYLGDGWEALRFKNQWVYASLVVGSFLLILVNIELLLRHVIGMLGYGNKLSDIGGEAVRAE